MRRAGPARHDAGIAGAAEGKDQDQALAERSMRAPPPAAGACEAEQEERGKDREHCSGGRDGEKEERVQ